jgi:hypothetical protein
MPVNSPYIKPWPKMHTPEGSAFFAAAEKTYQDWMVKTQSKKMSIALLAIAELRSGFAPGAPLYGLEDKPKKEGDKAEAPSESGETEYDAAWADLQKPESGLRFALATHNVGDAARALIQYWIRPHDHNDDERAAALAVRWEKFGNLS